MTRILKKTGLLFVLICITYTINKLIFFYIIDANKIINFQFSLELIHGIFATFSWVILFILIKVKQKDLDIVGNTFLLLTTIKMIACYVIARPILTKDGATEKWNFFIVFILYLLIETIITIQLLNEKD